MEKLRTSDGASGFPDPLESECDAFIAGHASTSISASIGIAKARDLKNRLLVTNSSESDLMEGDPARRTGVYSNVHEDLSTGSTKQKTDCGEFGKKSEAFKVISILGDGAMSGGMIYEALNNIAYIKDFIVILNDNQMSISESVGAMRRYLSKLLMSRKSLTLRKNFRRFLDSMPRNLATSIESLVKRSLIVVKGSNIFEEFGLQYIGPVDGHNIAELIEVFKNVRDIANYKPVLLHIITRKGMGYTAAENDSTKMHGVDHDKSRRYSDVFGKKIVELARADEKIVCITAAMKNGCGLREFADLFPERFFDVGIAEEHAVTFAAGLAKEGLKPFICIYSTFLQRAIDQIYHDVSLQNLPVRFIVDKAGLPGHDGKTHAGIYDISLLQNFDNIHIFSPGSRGDLEELLDVMAGEISYPCVLRFPKAESFEVLHDEIVQGTCTLIISCGDLLRNILEAIEMIDNGDSPTVWNLKILKPFDFELFYKLAENHERILVFEEGVFGGLSNIISEGLIKDNKIELLCKMKFYNVDKNPVKPSSRSEQLKNCHLSPREIKEILQG
jgi:1-deoxy-D-xylulose-5-phosphate synthase